MQEDAVEDLFACGVINLDKPRGPTSHEVTAWVKRMLGIEKTGHAGTLDPHVSGVLPIALGRATSAVQAMHLAPKEYVCVLRFHTDVEKSVAEEVFSNFKGRILQIPPVRSAVARRERTRTIHELEVLESHDRDYLFQVRCDAGTYIRTLCKDIGLSSGIGANMRELRRTVSGGFREEDSITLHDLSNALWAWRQEKDEGLIRKIVLPISTMFAHLKKVVIRDGAIDAVCHGAQVMVPGVERADAGIAKSEHVVITTRKGEVVALSMTLMDERHLQTLKKGMFARTIRVYMPRGTYPRAWRS
jgi:H/ACA ribonucleoprotein complex subunit 4